MKPIEIQKTKKLLEQYEGSDNFINSIKWQYEDGKFLSMKQLECAAKFFKNRGRAIIFRG
jgi:hypothetical protein